MFKKINDLLLPTLLATTLSLATTNAWSADITLRYSNWLPTTLFLWEDVFEPLFDEIDKATEGRVKIEVLPKVVGTPQTQYEVVSEGLADMSFTIASYTPGRFVGSEVGSLPLLGSMSPAMGPAFFRHFKKYIEPTGEFGDVKVLTMYVITPLQPITATRPIKTIEDFKGMKMRAPTPGSIAALKLLGGVPITKSAPESMEMLASGAIDGQFANPNTVPGFKALDLTKYITKVPGGMSTGVSFMFINPKTWAKISRADQKVIEHLTGEQLAQQAFAAYVEADNNALELMKASGYEIIQGDEKLRADLAEVLEPIQQEWVDAAKAKGIPDPEGQLAAYKAALAEAEK